MGTGQKEENKKGKEGKEKVSEAKRYIGVIKSTLFDIIDEVKDESVKIKLLKLIKDLL